jgi:hypothetical protein
MAPQSKAVKDTATMARVALNALCETEFMIFLFETISGHTCSRGVGEKTPVLLDLSVIRHPLGGRFI